MTAKRNNFRWMLSALALVVTFVVDIASAQETTARPVQLEMESFFVATHQEYRAKVADWKYYYIVDEDQEKLPIELAASRPAKPIHVHQCGGSSGIQQQTAKIFGPLADVYSYWALIFTSNDKPAEGSLIWPGMDNPFLNHARKMRELVGDNTPIVAYLFFNVAKGKEQRPALLEEMQWQFIAAAGCGYRGVLWPNAYEDTTLGDDLKQITVKANRHGRFLAQAKHIDWAKADKGQGISTLACDEYLFVFLLHPAYMTLDVTGNTVTIPLDKLTCEGTVTITLPQGLTIRRGQTLEGKTLRLTKQDATTTVPYNFTSGGEMLIFTLAGKAEQAAAVSGVTDAMNTETE